MTLDIPQFIANSIRTQSKIHHFDINVKATATDDIPSSVTSIIEKDYGKKYLDDADYVAFFWGGIGKEQIEKLFNVVDKALGKSANKLTNKDFKKINIKLSNDDQEVDVDDEVEIDDDNDNEEASDFEQEDAEEDVQLDEDDDKDIEIDDDEVEIDDDDDEQEEEEEVEVDIEEDMPIPTAYFFLKITIK